MSDSETISTASDLDSTAEDSGIMSENYFRIFFWDIRNYSMVQSDAV